MELQLTSAILITIIAILFSGLFSGTEIAFVQSSKVRMEIETSRGGIVNRILRRFYHNEDTFISTLLVGNNVVLVIYGIAISAIINPWLNDWFQNDAAVLIVNTIASTLIILFTGEFMPKITFRINPNLTMRLIALPVYIIYLVLYPVSALISHISLGLMKLLGIEPANAKPGRLTVEQLDDYIQQSLAGRADTEEIDSEVKIFRNAIDFKDTQIEECMIPRNEIVAVDLESTSRSELVNTFSSTGLSKIVVYRRDIDDIVGYIHVSELFKADTNWRDRIKPVIFTPMSMLANKMMRRMLAEKRSVVIVIDEFGGTAGLVTLEDLVEEICGEFEDEHDKKRLIARQTGENEYEFAGRVEIEQINEQFHLGIPENEHYHTLAGYILETRGELPRVNDTFTIGDLSFTVLRMSATKIKLLRVRRV